MVLKNLFNSLRSKGTFLIDIIGKEHLAKIFLPTTSHILPDGTLMVERREISDNWTRINNEWLLIRKGRVKSFRFYHRIYSGQELRLLMEQAGFIDVKVYGSFAGDVYGPDSIRLIIVGHKPKA